MNKRFLFTLSLAVLTLMTSPFIYKKGVSASAKDAKREFRGAWIQCVNGQFQGIGTQRMQSTLSYQLDELQKDGVNAIFFQVRPSCDALYESSIEPWSSFLTGEQGVAPVPYWDPLKWMIDECHKRGMELHAWINPYRAKTKTLSKLANSHIALRHPERVFAYDGQFILNPALPENREYIYQVVDDIITRYDVDGIHMDDYFYPYPAAGQTINDDKEFRMYCPESITSRGDFRRNNVNLFVYELGKRIKAKKPWCKYGISPFGIYRNKKNDPNGSATNGLQNYDDLYADVLLWVNQGWIDYCVPQLYWEIGNKAADYETLIKWWNQYAGNRPLYIGEDIERTAKFADPDIPSLNQMVAKYRLHDECTNVKGTVLWYAKAAVDNVGNYGNLLREFYWKKPALQPAMPWINSQVPGVVKKMKVKDYGQGPVLFWTAPKHTSWKDEPVKYAVYRFAKGEDLDISDFSHLLTITNETFCALPVQKKQKDVYVVTAIGRTDNEGEPAKKKY